MKKRIEEIKARLQKLPKKLVVRDTKVPMRIRDPKTGQIINCPRGRLQQTRMDVVAADDSFQLPIIHFHKFPDHPQYAGDNWKDFAEMFVNAHEDIQYLLEQLEGKSDVNCME